MRLLHSILVLMLLSFGAVALAQDEAATPESAETPAASAETSPGDIDALVKRWRETRQRAASVATLYNNSNPAKRDEILEEFTSTMEATSNVIAEMVPLLEKAYEQDPNSATVKEVMTDIARICFDFDQLGFCYRMSRPLAEVAQEPSVVHLYAGESAYELGKLDDAERFLTLAKGYNRLNAIQKRAVQGMLEKVPARREVLAKEQERLDADAQGEPLPQIRLKTNRGDIVIELFENDFPNTVASVTLLTEKGFYKDKSFFRVEQAFGAITGSPNNDGVGGPGYETLREEPKRGVRPHLHGYVSMVPMTPKTNGSQFLLTLRPSNCERFDGRQDVVGRIVEGLDVAARLRPYDLVQTKVDIEPDKIVTAEVVRKREHEYVPVTTGDLADEQFQAAMREFSKKNYEEAARLFNAAIAILPDNPTLHFNLGATYMNLKKVPEAEARFREAIRLNPQHLKSRQFLAGVLAEKKDFDGATATLNEALRLFPTDRTTLALLQALEKARAQNQQNPNASAAESTAPKSEPGSEK